MDVGGSPREFKLLIVPLLFVLLLVLLFDNFRRRSSRNNDFNGDTFINDGSGKLLDVAPLSESIPLLFGSCFIGINEIEGVIVSSPPPMLLIIEKLYFFKHENYLTFSILHHRFFYDGLRAVFFIKNCKFL